MTANNMYHSRTYAEHALEDGITASTYDQLCTLIPNMKVTNKLFGRATKPCHIKKYLTGLKVMDFISF